MVVRDTCPACSSPRYKNNGHTRHGKQNHQCPACGRQFTADGLNRRIASEQRQRIEQLLCERIALRGICRTVGVSLTWLLHLMVECFTHVGDRSDKSGQALWANIPLAYRDQVPGRNCIGPMARAYMTRFAVRLCTMTSLPGRVPSRVGP